MVYKSSRRRRLTASSHTTGHAGPHPAVQRELRSWLYRAVKLSSPELRQKALLRASCTGGQEAIRQGLVPVAPSLARSGGTPSRTNSRRRVAPCFQRFHSSCLSLRRVHSSSCS